MRPTRPSARRGRPAPEAAAARPAVATAEPGVAALTVAGANPTAGPVRLRLTLAAEARVEGAVYDALGRRVAAVPARSLAAGAHPLDLALGDLAGGVYVVRVTVDDGRAVVPYVRTVTVLR